MKLSLTILLSVIVVSVLSEYRTLNGRGNNIDNPYWGSVNATYLRGNGFTSWPARYADNVSEPWPGPSSRFISNMLPGSGVAIEDPNPISAMHIFWGQFLDHDVTLAPSSNEDQILIPVPEDDAVFAAFGCAGNCTMPLSRSLYRNENGVREQFNGVSAFIDGSSVYGSDPDIIAALREPGSCRLRVVPSANGDMLPRNEGQLPMTNDPGQFPHANLFLAGDVRANENPGLTALHTLFVREHNRLCGTIATANPTWDQDRLFQEARKWVIAYMQRITFSEYMATTLGGSLPDYTGYRPDVNPGIDNLFSTATFRYGHSEVLEVIPRRGPNFENFAQGDLPLKDCFFNPTCWEAQGIDPILRGMVAVRQNKVDIFYPQAILNTLFGRGPHNIVAVDLFARNIERGRDHGLPSYNDARAYFGLSRRNTFEEISTNPKHVAALRNAYATVDDIEVYAGALAEDYFDGGFVGELVAASVRDQYIRLRDGDRFYYENTAVSGFTPEEIRTIQSTRLADIIVRNTGIRRISCSTMFTPPGDSFSQVECGPDAWRPLTGHTLSGSFSTIAGSYNLSWNVNVEARTVAIEMSARTAGWVGFGIPDPAGLGGMIGGDAVIGWVETDGRVTVGAYDLLSRTPACENGNGVCRNEAGSSLITGVSGTEANGWTTIRFTRPLASEHNWEIVEGLNRVILAHGPVKGLSRHGINLARPQVSFFDTSREYRTLDGRGNNLRNPEWGSAGVTFLRGDGQRKWPARYEDGVGEPINARSSRFVSNMLPGSGVAVVDPNPISAMHIFWGQFLDHDITLTPNANNEVRLIPIPEDDAIFNTFGCVGNCTMPFGRSLYRMENGVREQFNKISSFVDGSNVYGADPVIAAALRVPNSCLMRVSQTNVGDMLPKNNVDGTPINIANDPGVVNMNTLFLAGDVRANENPALAALHTLFVREHNRLCGDLATRFPSYNAETLFQEARRWNVALMQRITFSEYIAATIGGGLPPYRGYNENVNPGIDTLFATATFRYGHSEVLEEIPRRGVNYTAFAQGDLKLKECFFNPTCWEQYGIEPILRGITAVRQNKVDIFYPQAILNTLFGRGPNGMVAVDLFARNIERGRDHGLISYNDAREFFGLPRKTTFEEISANRNHTDALRNAYATVDDIEVYAGALAEDHPPGAFVGELLVYSLRDQYIRLRDGDRFYYQNTAVSGFTAEEVAQIDQTRLADIIVRNTGIRAIACTTMFVAPNFNQLDCGPDAWQPDNNNDGFNGTFASPINYNLEWAVDPAAGVIRVSMSARTSGWVGFGIPLPTGGGGMIGGDAVIGWVETDGRVTIGNYDLLGRVPGCPDGVCINEPGTALLTEVTGTEVDGWTTIRFTRKLASEHNWEIVEGLNRMIFAHGPEKRLIFHGPNMGRAALTFFGDAPITSTSQDTTTGTSAPSGNCLPAEGDFANVVQFLGGDYLLHYNIDGTAREIRAVIAGRTNQNGWVGMGISQGDVARMTGSHATVGFMLNGQPNVAAWNLNAQEETQVVRDPAVTLTDTNVCFENGFLVVSFTRSLDTWTNLRFEEINGTIPETPAVFAFSADPPSPDGNRLNWHGPITRVPVMVNFATGGTTEIDNSWIRLVHAICMMVGWGALNLGALYARFTRKVKGAFWFKVHRPVQYGGFAVAVFGFLWIIIARAVENKGAAPHFNQPLAHGILGLITMIGAAIQVVLAFFRPHPSKIGENSFTRKAWEWQHHSFARILCVLAIITAFFGAINFTGGYNNIFVGTFLGVICCWLFLTLNLEYVKQVVDKQERESNLYYKME